MYVKNLQGAWYKIDDSKVMFLKNEKQNMKKIPSRPLPNITHLQIDTA